MTTVKSIVIHMRTVYIYIYEYDSKISTGNNIFIKYITKLLRLVLLPCYRMMKSVTFSKKSGAATKGFESCEFWFQVAFFNRAYPENTTFEPHLPRHLKFHTFDNLHTTKKC